MKHISTLLAALVLSAGVSLNATAADDTSSLTATAPAQADAPVSLADGEIRKVDKEAGKITIKHGPLVNLDMPPMTMVFRVKDPLMLEQVKAGEKVRFTAEKLNGALTVTTLEPAK